MQTINNAGVLLFQRLYKPTENTLISPLSLCMVLSLAANLAGGKTREEFEKFLCDSKGVTPLNEVYADYLKRVKSDSNVEFLIANAAYLHSSLQDTSEYMLCNLREYYQAEIKRVDFADTLVLNEINAWVFDATKGKIPKLLENLDADHTAVLLNAIYFNGDWSEKFDTALTKKASFYNRDDTMVSVDFMQKKTDMQYVEDEYFLGVVNQYKGGGYRFFALMPKGDFDTAVRDLNYTQLTWLLRSGREQEVCLRLPKFKVETPTLSVVDAVRDLGVRLAFTSDANLSALGKMPDGRNSFIGNILHKATFEVDEKGTEASAATAVCMSRGISIPKPRKEITFEHPFLYGIIDETGSLSFLGSIVKLS